MLLTPHAAFYSVEALRESRTKGAEQVLRAVRGSPCATASTCPHCARPRAPVQGWSERGPEPA